MLIDGGEAIPRARAIVNDRCFFRDSHGVLFRALSEVYDTNGRVDHVLLKAHLVEVGDFDAIGGIPFLAQLYDTPSAANIEYHARIVARSAYERRIADLSRELAAHPGDVPLQVALVDALAQAPEATAGGSRTRFQLHTATEIEELPPPESLIGDKLTRGGLSALAGVPGSGKSFVALSWALSVSEGVPWCGSLVHRGPVVYVAAEGSAGLGARVRAWKAANHIFGSVGVHFVTEPVSLLESSEVRYFLRSLEVLPEPPVLVILDTLARCMIGGDENSTKDMSAFIAGADQIRSRFGSHVSILHHLNAGGERERGNTALRGAVDTLLFLKGENDDLTLSCEKQKDAPPFRKLSMRLVRAAESCSVMPDEGAKDGLHRTAVRIPDKHLDALALFCTHFLADGATASEWMEASGMPKRSFFYARTQLVERGYVSAPEQLRGGRYRITDDGQRALGARCK